MRPRGQRDEEERGRDKRTLQKKERTDFFVLLPSSIHTTLSFTSFLAYSHTLSLPFLFSSLLRHPPHTHSLSNYSHSPVNKSLGKLPSSHPSFTSPNLKKQMRVSILTDQGDLHTIEVDSQMELENIKALLEADVSYLLALLQAKKKVPVPPLT